MSSSTSAVIYRDATMPPVITGGDKACEGVEHSNGPNIGHLQTLIGSHIETKNPNFSGAILVGVKDKIVFHRQYGFEITPDSQFIIASITKQITAALIVIALKDKRVSLDSTLDQFLIEVKDEWVKRVTVHHLLTHTSGVEGFGKELKFLPGEKYDYSNFGYSLLGRVLEHLTNKRYSELVGEFLAKLDMHATCVTGEGTISEIQERIPGLVRGYDKDEHGRLTPINNPRTAFDFPAKGLVSTACDLFKWNCLLHQGKILDKDEYSKMVQPYAQVSDSVDYGYGLKIPRLDGLKEIGHNGETHGYLTTVLYYPDAEMSVIILGNHFPFPISGNPENICQEHNAIRDIVREYLRSDLSSRERWLKV